MKKFEGKRALIESVIQRIKYNALDAVKIRKLAASAGTDYQTARILYNRGRRGVDRETAAKIVEKCRAEKIPMHIIDNIDKAGFNYQDKFDFLANLYNQINVAAPNKTINDLDCYLASRYYYGKYIYDLMKKGYTLEHAVQIFDEKIKEITSRSEMTKISAICQLLWNFSDTTASLFEKEYLAKRAIRNDPYQTVRNAILTSNEFYREQLHGITLVSKTPSGLEEFKKYITGCLQTNNKKFIRHFCEEAEKYNLLITDFIVLNNSNSHYHRGITYIYIKPKRQIEDFFHEAMHFLDHAKEMDKGKSKGFYFSSKDGKLLAVLDKIKNEFRVKARYLSLLMHPYINATRYVKNSELNDKWLEEILKEDPSLCGENLNYKLQQRRLYERKRYSIFSYTLLDIYDGIYKGKLSSFFGGQTHGRKYFSESYQILTEFIADISGIVGAGGLDFLRFEFGEELASEILEVCQNYISSDTNQKTHT